MNRPPCPAPIPIPAHTRIRTQTSFLPFPLPPPRYILGERPAYDDAKGKGGYVLVYYRGNNDAWDG